MGKSQGVSREDADSLRFLCGEYHPEKTKKRGLLPGKTRWEAPSFCRGGLWTLGEKGVEINFEKRLKGGRLE